LGNIYDELMKVFGKKAKKSKNRAQDSRLFSGIFGVDVIDDLSPFFPWR